MAESEIDYFFDHDLGLLYSFIVLDLPLRVVPTKFRTYPHWMIFSKTMPVSIQAIIDTELRDMIATGEVERIWKKYKPVSS